MNETETRTYFGDSIEELLPQIREELGPEALIVRQREGIVGGIGGFFGRKCVEVEARPGLAHAGLPPRAVVDAYDTGEPWEPVQAEPEPADEPDREQTAATERKQRQDLLETLLAQTSPFAERLQTAISDVPEEEPPLEAPAPRVTRRLVAPPRPSAGSLEDLVAIRKDLLAAAVPVKLVADVLEEVEHTLRPFEPGVPVRQLARRALAQRIQVASGWRARRRTLALVGLRRSGRTLAAASLCAAYARDGRSVCALSLEPARKAMRLAELTKGDDIPFQVADAPDLALRVRGMVRDAEVVVADTPPLADGIDGNRLADTLELLGALEPDETHLVLPAATPLEDARTLVESLVAHRLPSRLLVSHADSAAASGVAVGLALTHRIPVSFVAGGPGLGALRPAAPDALARMVLQ